MTYTSNKVGMYNFNKAGDGKVDRQRRGSPRAGTLFDMSAASWSPGRDLVSVN